MSDLSLQNLIYLNEQTISEILTWPMVYWCVERALRSVVPTILMSNSSQPNSVQKARSITKLPNNSSGVLLSMPGYIGNYSLPKDLDFLTNNIETISNDNEQYFDTLGCKLVTSFPLNEKLQPSPLPTIMGTIFLFNSQTGKLNAILEATKITAWRTAAASLVATQYLFFNRHNINGNNKSSLSRPIHLAIIGAGVQGRIHSIGMLNKYNFSSISIWNRSPQRVVTLVNELNEMKSTFCNNNIEIRNCQTISECVKNADVIVIATYSSQPLLNIDMVKKGAHINAIGAGINHHSELDLNIYKTSKVYVDDIESAKIELVDIMENISGMVGELIVQNKSSISSLPSVDDVTVFQSLGMAVEDTAVAQAVVEIYKNNKNLHI